MAASGWFEVDRGRWSGNGNGSGGGGAGSAAETGAETGAGRGEPTGRGGGGRGNNGWKLMLVTYDDYLAAEEEERRRTADGPGGVDAESTWVKEIGWAKYLEGKDLVELYEASLGPVSSAARERLRDAAAKEEQQRLARLGESFDREAARCAGRLKAVPYETLRWLASIDPNKLAGRPFGTKDHASSIDRYRTYWKRYLCYCVRTRRLGRDGAEVRDDDGDDDGDDDEEEGERDGGETTGTDRPGGQPDDPDDMDVDVVERFKDEYRRWLADGSNTPFSTIIRWMSYGKGHRRKEGGTARIIWEEGGEALRYLGQRIELREFRNAVRAGVREAEDLLDGLFFGGWADARASIETARVVDSMVYEGPGRSFATNGKNEWLRPGYRRVAELARGAL
ncbi:hypothetical protein DL771_011044 [Monosporascus sp. 5C6A]|nr:hypothetical protein DL771_011044 [Monosporascus sp. 5C6A]